MAALTGRVGSKRCQVSDRPRENQIAAILMLGPEGMSQVTEDEWQFLAAILVAQANRAIARSIEKAGIRQKIKERRPVEQSSAFNAALQQEQSGARVGGIAGSISASSLRRLATYTDCMGLQCMAQQRRIESNTRTGSAYRAAGIADLASRAQALVALRRAASRETKMTPEMHESCRVNAQDYLRRVTGTMLADATISGWGLPLVRRLLMQDRSAEVAPIAVPDQLDEVPGREAPELVARLAEARTLKSSSWKTIQIVLAANKAGDDVYKVNLYALKHEHQQFASVKKHRARRWGRTIMPLLLRYVARTPASWISGKRARRPLSQKAWLLLKLTATLWLAKS